jgi:hypothetical protein
MRMYEGEGEERELNHCVPTDGACGAMIALGGIAGMRQVLSRALFRIGSTTEQLIIPILSPSDGPPASAFPTSWLNAGETL